MTGSLFTIDVRPTAELMLAADAIVQALNRVAVAIETSNKTAEASTMDQPCAAATVTTLPPARKPLSPEQLTALRLNAEKARAAKAARLTGGAPEPEPQIVARPAPALDLSGLAALGTVTERKAPPAVPGPAPRTTPAAQPKSRMEAIAVVSKAISARPAIDPGESVAAGFETVRRWAGERGIQFAQWDDLPAVNARRERLGLAWFKRDFPVKGVFA